MTCQTTSDGLLGTLKHGRGQEMASTSPTREIGMACRPHTHDGHHGHDDGEPDEAN